MGQIVGSSSTTATFVVHWNGWAWSLVPLPTLTNGPATTFACVWGSGPTDVWVGGSTSGTPTGVVVHSNARQRALAHG